jgi:hypothetical protein
MNLLVLELLKKDVDVWVRAKPLLTPKEASEDLEIALPKLKKRLRLGLIATINLAGARPCTRCTR